MTHWNRQPGIPREQFSEEFLLSLLFAAFWSPTIAYTIVFATEPLNTASEFVVTMLGLIAGLATVIAPFFVVGGVCLLQVGLGKKLALIVLSLVAFAAQYLILFGWIALSLSGFEGIH